MEALVASGFAVIVAGITVATRSAIGKRVFRHSLMTART